MTVQLRYQGLVAVMIAQPDYTPEDWDAAVDELVTRNFLPSSTEPIAVLPDGTEVLVWQQFPVGSVLIAPASPAELYVADGHRR